MLGEEPKMAFSVFGGVLEFAVNSLVGLFDYLHGFGFGMGAVRGDVGDEDGETLRPGAELEWA